MSLEDDPSPDMLDGTFFRSAREELLARGTDRLLRRGEERERARLRPLLERCHAMLVFGISGVQYDAILADLRKELGIVSVEMGKEG